MWFSKLIKRQVTRAFRDLYPAARFRAAMDRERACADRWGLPLTLLTFGTDSGARRRQTLIRVARRLRRRIRTTDEAGWLDARHIGVLMPNTPAWGAWTLADEICRAFPAGVPIPECRVYCYPSNWFGSDRGPLDEVPDALRAVRFARVAQNGHASNVECRMANGDCHWAFGLRDSSLAMEPFFIRPLPLWKRAVDIVGAVLFLTIHTPLYLTVAILIRTTLRGPVFFRQTRVGLGGRRFTMYKYRTMVENAENLKNELQPRNEQEGPVFKIRNDPRVTALGRFLRKFSLDEFPQMWNVLMGDMSLVGCVLPCRKRSSITRSGSSAAFT